MRRTLNWLMTMAVVATLASCGQTETVTAPTVEGPGLTTSSSVAVPHEGPSAWFVQFSSPPAVRGGSPGAHANERAVFRSAALAERIAFQERYEFSTLFNGLSIVAGPAEVAKLARLPGVEAVFPVETVAMPEPQPGIAPELYTALAMTGADIVQNDLGFTGAGVKVAVMDTGIDYDHPDLGGAFGPGERVAYGWDFVGDAFNADPTSASYNPVPSPDPDPDDCGGHGTHVAGIVGADGIVTGVAPGVTFGAYRVFGCEGSTTADIMILAMEMALADGMDVLNMSIGSSFQWPQYPTAVAASNLVDAGMVVVASIGNSGASGLYAAGAPGLGEQVIGVASFDNTEVFLDIFEVADEEIGYIPFTFSPEVPTSGSSEVEFVGLACVPLVEDLAGTVALVARGACNFSVKATNARDAGAVAVVIHNSSPGAFSGTLGGPIPDMVPVVAISQEHGMFMRSQPAPVVMTWTDGGRSFASPTGGLISSFSSYGLSPDLALKPDLGAPGGNIYSTYPLESGAYATLSGTSMAAPHVAGAAALLLEARPDVAAPDVRGVLQNSADPKNWFGNPGLGFLDQVHRQGAGMLDIDDAILSTAVVTPSKIATGESEAGPFRQDLKIENHGDEALTYALGHVPALSTGPNTFSVPVTTGFASVAFSAPTVTVPAGGSAWVSATITANAGLADRSQYGGYLVLTPDDGSDVLRVPYAGLKGDYQGIQVLNAGPVPTIPMPWAAVLIDGFFYPLSDPSDWSFTMEGDDVPFFLIHFDHQSQYMEMNILHAEDLSPVHSVFHKTNVFEYLPRNASPGGFFDFAWDGTRFQSQMYRGKGSKDLFKLVPNGTYVIELKVLKALGDANDPAHWETWTSPGITIARP